MLKAIGAETIDELFADIPENVRFQKTTKLKSKIRNRADERADEACGEK